MTLKIATKYLEWVSFNDAASKGWLPSNSTQIFILGSVMTPVFGPASIILLLALWVFVVFTMWTF